jgi:hypothetical protein
MTDQLRQLPRGVVEIPGRHFPGIVIMGDTLASITHDVEQALHYLKVELKLSSNGPGMDRLEYARDRLRERLDAYKITLNERGIPLPFGDE